MNRNIVSSKTAEDEKDFIGLSEERIKEVENEIIELSKKEIKILQDNENLSKKIQESENEMIEKNKEEIKILKDNHKNLFEPVTKIESSSTVEEDEKIKEIKNNSVLEPNCNKSIEEEIKEEMKECKKLRADLKKRKKKLEELELKKENTLEGEFINIEEAEKEIES